MNIIKALETISQWDNPPMLFDGANTWDTYGLMDCINQNDDINTKDYIIEANGIYELDSNDYLKSIPAYKFIDSDDQ